MKRAPNSPPSIVPPPPTAWVPAEEQASNRLFALALSWAAYGAMTVAAVALVLYVFGGLPPFVPVDTLMHLWGQSAHDLSLSAHLPTGWQWLQGLHHGDFLALGALALFAGAVIPAHLALVPVLIRRKDWVYLALVLAQVAVFLVAAWPVGEGRSPSPTPPTQQGAVSARKAGLGPARQR